MYHEQVNVIPIVDPGRNLDMVVSWPSSVRTLVTRSSACCSTVVDTKTSWARGSGWSASSMGVDLQREVSDMGASVSK